MYVDPDRLLFMFDLPTLTIYINEFLYPPLYPCSKNGDESYEKYRNPALLDQKSGVTTGYPALRLDAGVTT